MQPYADRMASRQTATPVFRVYPGCIGADNTYTLYEDDGLAMDYVLGGYALTRLTYSLIGGMLMLTVFPAEGEYNGQPQERSVVFELVDLSPGRR